jgi:DNA replication and repair protein RecF
MLGTGKSFRTHHEVELIRSGDETATVSGDAQMRAGSVHLSCSVAKGPRGTQKRYARNGQSIRYAAFLGNARVVTFAPGDLHLVPGPPSARRALLNTALAQTQPLYYRDLARYQRAVQQKSALLKTETLDAELLAVYNQTLLDTGTSVMLARRSFVLALAVVARDAHSQVARDEALEVRYDPSIRFESVTEDDIKAAFAARLSEVAEAERARGSALVGPHRDDVELLLDGVSLAAFGSQGQQRTAVLALKVAEYAVMHERTGEAPLLLLDDVLSELDQQRAGAFLAGVGAFEQGFVTATQLPAGLRSARIWTIGGGRLEEAA